MKEITLSAAVQLYKKIKYIISKVGKNALSAGGTGSCPPDEEGNMKFKNLRGVFSAFRCCIKNILFAAGCRKDILK